jgi:phthalate 4,5-dioxygenase oxygenase subunit
LPETSGPAGRDPLSAIDWRHSAVSREHLGRTDVAVLQFRRIMLDAVEAFGKAGVVLGQQAPVIPFAKVRSYEGIVAKGTDWESLGLCEEERGLPKDAVAAE